MRRFLALILGAVLSLAALPAQAATTPPIAAHRGAQNVAGVPESSMTAYRWAADSGAAVIEVDLRWTKDLRMVILHDDTLDRTTDCTGQVSAVMYSALRKCANTDTVPDFYAVLSFARSRGLQVLVEPKGLATDWNAHEAVERVNDYGMASRTVFYSFTTTPLNRIKKQPGVAGLRFGLISAPGAAVSPSAARAVGTVYAPNWRDLTTSNVAAYKAAGLKLWVWAAPEQYANVRNLGVDVMHVDDAKRAVAWRNAQP